MTDAVSTSSISPRTRAYLLAELLLLYFVLPVVVWDMNTKVVLLPLWFFTALCGIVLLRSRTFSRAKLGLGTHPIHWRSELPRIFIIFLPSAAVLVVLTMLLDCSRLLEFPRHYPLFWGVVMLLYPILSVYPQTLTHRIFIFHRYRRLFPQPWMIVMVSALAFSWMHIVMHNWVAPMLTLPGGLFFAWTYQRTNSALVSTLEHALYGCFVFTIGLGHYFYPGTLALFQK